MGVLVGVLVGAFHSSEPHREEIVIDAVGISIVWGENAAFFASLCKNIRNIAAHNEKYCIFAS
jgi:hypothetical protein